MRDKGLPRSETSGVRATRTRGNPTSGGNGGGAGGLSNAGSTCSATSAAAPTATTFPSPFQRTRTPLTPSKGTSAPELTP
jgi:hypothetical protein